MMACALAYSVAGSAVPMQDRVIEPQVVEPDHSTTRRLDVVHHSHDLARLIDPLAHFPCTPGTTLSVFQCDGEGIGVGFDVVYPIVFHMSAREKDPRPEGRGKGHCEWIT